MRRRLGRAIAALSIWTAACSSGSKGEPAAADAGSQDAEPDAGSSSMLVGIVDLPREKSTQGLSGTWFDAANGTIYAIQDTEPAFVPLSVSADFRTITPGPPIALTGRPDPTWDGEALVRVGDVF